jgi:hypothetical protein
MDARNGSCHGAGMGFFGFFRDKKEKSATKTQKSAESEAALRDLVFSIEEKELIALLPALKGKQALEIAPHQKSLDGFLEEKGAKLVRVGGAREKDLGKAGKFAFSHWENIPLFPGSQDVVLLRTAFLKASPARLLKEAARLLSLHGRIVLSELHPFRLLSRGDGGGTEPAGFERYWKYFEEAGLKLTAIREVFFENTMKKVVFDDAKKVEILKNTPVLLLFVLEKSS